MVQSLSQGSFTINNQSESKVFNRIFIAEPSVPQEKLIGKIFCLAETAANVEFEQKIADLIADEVKNNYYTLENLEAEKNLEDIFEDFLYGLNQKIHRFVQEEKNFFDFSKINILIGVVRPEIIDKKIAFGLHFSQVGKMEMILIQKLGFKNYKLTQTNKNAPTDSNKPNPFKFFSNIVSGRLNNEDYLILCGPAILDYISLDKIKNSVINLTPNKVVEHFKSLLMEVDERIPFSFIVFNLALSKEYFETTETIKIEAMPEITPGKTLPHSEQKTVTVTTSSRRPMTSGLLAKIFKRRERKNVQPAAASAISQPERILPAPLSIWQRLKRLIRKFFKATRSTKKFITMEKAQRDQTVERWSEQKLKKIDSKVAGLKRVPFSSKIMLIGGIIFIMLFLGGLSFVYLGQKQKKEKEAVDKIVQQIEEKKNLIDSSLIYNDETRAKQNLNEAWDLLKLLPQKNDEQKALIKTITDNLNAFDQKIKKVVNLPEQAPLLDFSQIIKDSAVSGIIFYNNNLYAWQAQGNKIYRVNLSEKNVFPFNYQAISGGEFSNVANFSAEAKVLLFYNNDKTFTKFDLAKPSLAKQEIKLPDSIEVADFKIYNNRLYIVDKKNNQIYKYSTTPSGFGSLANWLTSKITLTDAVSMAIDSNIYILTSKGQVLKFFTGKPQNFSISGLDPALTRPTKLFTSLDDKYLYILEPSQKRLVVLDKTGKFIVQYYSDKFSNLLDFAVSEKNKKIYLLNGQGLYQLETDYIK